MTASLKYETTRRDDTAVERPIELSPAQCELIETVEGYVTSAVEQRLRTNYPNQHLLGVLVGLTDGINTDVMTVDVVLERRYPHIHSFTIKNPQALVNSSSDYTEAACKIGIVAAQTACAQI